MIAAREEIEGTTDGLRLALPCGHELVLPPDLSVPGMSVSVLGHQLSCSADATSGAEPAEYDFTTESDSLSRRDRRLPPVAPVPIVRRRPEGR